ncbi:MAG: DUF6198 family protein [Veillonellaceae bacterium]|nr:DUF6198 family protein [Veillonellaceae bacterium]MDD6924100.1 DUF6198 family protein [Veillonellaceae bacterium]
MSILKRYSIFIIAIIIQSSGISLVVKSMLGTSPISSFPYVLSLAFPFSLGQFTFAINMLLVLGQVLLLRRDFDRVQWLQIPMTMIFAYAIDVFMDIWSSPENYLIKLLPLAFGATFIALGVALQGIANVLMLPGEGIVYAVSRRFCIAFGKVKTANDVLLVVLAMIISLVYLGDIEGIREGTLFSAVVTGGIAQFFLRHLARVDTYGHLVLKNPFASETNDREKSMQKPESKTAR